MSDGRFAILDPAAGISGDMVLGALLAAGAPEAWLLGLPERLGLADVRVEVRQVDRCGVRATKVDVLLADGRHEAPSELVHAPHAHPHAHEDHHAPHRHVGELIDVLARAPLSERVRSRAIRAFELLGEAEGRIHGVPAAQVALHEVGAMDALVDVVGAIEGFEQLGIDRIYHRPVAVERLGARCARDDPAACAGHGGAAGGLGDRHRRPGRGRSHDSHRSRSPSSAIVGDPTRALANRGRRRLGAGGRDPDAYPNALRLIVAEAAGEAGDVAVLSTDLDDLSPEYLEPLREALMDAGALDVQMWATQMKKGRIGFRVEAVVPPGEADRVTDALVRHSTTAGVRRQMVQRYTVPRRQLEVDAGGGISVRVKVLDAPGGPRLKPEFDDVAAVARKTGRPAHEVARDLHQRALRLVGPDEAAKAVTPNKESYE